MEKLVVKIGRQYRFVDPAEIDWVESSQNYVRLYVGAQSFLLRRTMCSMAALGDGWPVFVRVNRRTLVNRARIRELHSLGCNRYRVVLEGGRSFLWGRGYREQLHILKESGNPREQGTKKPVA